MTPFANRVALITGAANGIGRQLALELSSRGALIAAVDRDAGTLDKLDLAGKPMERCVADVTDRDSLHAAVKQVSARLGPIDLLFANAGLGYETSALKYNGAEIEKIIQVNLIGVANSIDAVLPGMLERRRGHLVGISSLASYRGLPRMAGYCASKAGVNALLDGLRVELKPCGIQVTTVCPGWIRTAMTAQVGHLAMSELMDVSEAARRIVDAVARGRTFFAFPSNTARRVRLIGMLPCTIGDWLINRMLRKVPKSPTE